MKFINIVFMIVFSILFSYLIITFATQGGDEYGLDTSEFTGGKFNITGINESLGLKQGESEEWKNASTQQTNIDYSGGVKAEGMYNTVTLMWNILTSPFVLLWQIMVNVLHIPKEVSTIIYFSFTIILIFAVWKLIKTGE